MKSSILRELLLYRYRYVVGYALFVVFLFGILLIDIGNVPGGISQSEMASSVASNSLNPLSPLATDVINLPYHLLQKLSIGLVGLSPLGIRLPSLILAFIAAIVLAFTLNQWFRKGIAILTLLLGTASVPFISMGRSGTAAVMYMLLLLIILLAAVKLTTMGKRTFIWKLVVTAAGVLLFYMPLGIYAVLALLIAGIFHPHVRYQIKRTRPWQFAALVLTAGILLTPLILAGIHDANTVQVLFGVDELKEKLTLSSIAASIVSIAKTLFLFNRPFTGEVVAPYFNLIFMFLIAFGLARAIIDRHSARSYLLLIWLAMSIPLLILNPSQFALLFVPCLILLAVGLETFMREWYQLFPRNPYARLAALVPIFLITLGLVTIAGTRYFYGYYYTDTSHTYHQGLVAVRETVKPFVPTQLVVAPDQVAFYDILRSKYPELSVVGPADAKTSREQVVLARSGFSRPDIPSEIVTSHLANDSVILRVYGAQR